jgi:hypothetical protein
MQYTIDAYFVGQSVEDSRRHAPFFTVEEAKDYASDHGGQVFTAETVVTIVDDPAEPWCNHDAAALTPTEANLCECGALVPVVSSFEDDAEYGAGWNEPPVRLA